MLTLTSFLMTFSAVAQEEPTCQDMVYYLSDHDTEIGISDIYQVTLIGGEATMEHIATSDIEVHIAYNPVDNMLYAISKHENSYRILDPILGTWSSEYSLGGDYGELTAAVFNQDGKLLIGSQTQKAIYVVNVITNMVSSYDTYAPLNGGDLAFRSDGMLYMATRSGNGLYEVWSAPMNDNLIGTLPSKVTGLAITDTDQLLISAQGQTSLLVYNSDGSDAGVGYDLMLNDELYTLRDGDMASGCNTRPPFTGYCDDFTTFYVNHGPDIDGSNLYKVNFTSGGFANLVFLTNVTYEAHIAYNANDNLVYFVNVDGSSIQIYDVILQSFLGDVTIDGSFTKLTAALYNPNDSLLYIGDHNADQVHTVNLSTGVATFYANAPVSGGDLEMLDNGDIYLATRSGSGLYKVVEGAPAEFVGNIPPTVNGMARANDDLNSFVLANKNSTVFTHIDAMDGSVIGTFQIMLNGVPFTTVDGDMAAGCGDSSPSIETGGCYATEVIEYVQGTSKNGGAIATNRTNASKALGAPERTDANVFVSLGYGGSLTLSFDGSIPNGPGNDIEIVETSFNTTSCAAYPEYADVYVSVDGTSWFQAGTVCKFEPFVDISDAGDFDYVNFVKIVNNNTMTTTPDGFDVDGVVALHNCIDGDLTPPVIPFTTVEATSTLTSYPNPTDGPSKVVFVTGESTKALVEIYDMSGRSVGTIFNAEVQKGQEYLIDFDGSNLSRGVYIYRLTTPHETIIEKFMIAR